MTSRKSPEAVRSLVESYLQRECSPEISRVFRTEAPQDDRIAGTPSFEDLRLFPPMAAFIAGRNDHLDVTTGMSAIKGVTVSMSLTLIDREKKVVASCEWRAGTGIRFHAPGLN